MRPSCLREQPRHARDQPGDGAAEPAEEQNESRYQHDEDDGVFGHRLTGLERQLLEPVNHVVLADGHVFVLPLPSLFALCRYGRTLATLLIACEIPPDSAVNATITASAITARTTPYSAIV